MTKKKVLWLSDFNCATGFATVAHNIVGQLLGTGEYEFDVVGINHFGEPYDFVKWPFPIYPARDLLKAGTSKAYADPYGRQRFLDLLGTGKYDIVFTLQDPHIIEPLAGKIVQAKKLFKFRWIFYYPVDGKVKDSWINSCVALADIPVAYTRFGRQETLRVNPAVNPRIIYHGVDTDTFYPLEDVAAFRQAYFGDHADKFIVANVNRNQPRKDIPRTIAAFKRFHEHRPHSALYLHMKPTDLGGNVVEMAVNCGLDPDRDLLIPDGFEESKGYPPEILNKLYNAVDVLVSTSLGEGWGLTVTEAMAAKTPVIVPDNTALREIGAEGRARLVKCGREFICLGAADSNQYRPLTDTDDLVAALTDCHDNREKYRVMADCAYKWVTGLSWDIIGRQWREVFKRAAQA